MKITIEVKESVTCPDYWDLQIDGSGWDKGIDPGQIRDVVKQHIIATMEILEATRIRK